MQSWKLNNNMAFYFLEPSSNVVINIKRDVLASWSERERDVFTRKY